MNDKSVTIISVEITRKGSPALPYLGECLSVIVMCRIGYLVLDNF